MLKKFVYTVTAVVCVIALIGLFSSAALADVADTVYTNGKIYTVNEAQPWAEAVAIKDGKFIAVGSAEDVETAVGKKTEVIDLKGRFVMPGFVDTHTHAILASVEQLDWLQFDPVPTSLEEIQNSLKAYAEENPDLEWIQAGNFPKGLFDRESPHRTWLDKVVSDRPVTILDQGGHSKWCNTKALEVAGMMDPGFKVPAFGIVERDEDGLPSGTIRETSLGHMGRYIPPIAPELYRKAVNFSQDLFNRSGITAHRSADGEIEHLKVLKAMSDEGGLTMHWAMGLDINYYNSVYTFDERMDQVENRKQYAAEFLGVDFVKIFADGDLNGFGIKMLEPFEGTTDQYGKMNMEPDEVIRLTKKFDREGVSVQFHAIGDATVEVVAQALEAAAEQNGGKLNTRHYPDHLGFITPDQIKRITHLNGLIGFAPYFAMTTPGVHDSYLQFVGKERLNRMQPARSALNAGAILGTGSDYPAFPPNPFPILEGMTHRRNPWVDPDDKSEANNASESISIDEAIHAYTLGGAHALLKEDTIGSIETGKYADFIVLDHNLIKIPVDDIDSTKVLQTVFNGNVVFEREKAIANLEVVDIEITNENLDNAVDAAQLDLLVTLEFGSRNNPSGCFSDDPTGPGSEDAPEEVNRAFGSLGLKGFGFARHAKEIHWENTSTDYWIQWTVKDDTSVLFAYDPIEKKAVEVLRVREK